MIDGPQEVFAYADPITQSGITVERTEASFRVTTPPEKFTEILRRNWFVLGFSFFMTGCGVILPMRDPKMIVVLPAPLVYTIAFSLFTYRRYRSTTVFSIENRIVQVTQLCWPFSPRVKSWPVAEVSDVRVQLRYGFPLIRVIDKESVGLAEFYITRERKLAEFVVQALSQALRGQPQTAVVAGITFGTQKKDNGT